MFFHEECRIYLTTLSGLFNILSRAASSASVAPCLLMAENHSLTHLGYLLYTTKLWVFLLASRSPTWLVLYIHTAPIDAFSVEREFMRQYGFVDSVRAVTLREST